MVEIIMNLGGTGKAPKGGFKLITGIGAAVPLAVNPSNKEYEDIVGKEIPYELKYDIRETDGIEYKPIHILVYNKEHDVHGFVKFWISNEDEVSKNGDKVNSMDPKGVTAWNLVDGNVDYAWFDAADSIPMKRGESNLHDFLQAFTKYDQRAEDANWRIALAEIGCTADNLFQGNTKGLEDLIKWATTQQAGDVVGHSVGVLWTVRKSPKKDKDTGSEIPGEFNYNQDILNRHFFMTDGEGGISNGAYKKLKTIETKQRKAGYEVTSQLYTYKLQEFNEEDCVGAPSATLEKAQSSSGGSKFSF